MSLLNVNKINKGEYHIHIDASYLSSQTEALLLDKFGFVDTAFSGHAEGALHFETPKHFTFKIKDRADFNQKFDAVQQYFIDNPGSIVGYLEGEYVPLDLDIVSKPFDRTVPVPFKLDLTNLASGSFREDEIHITLDREKSEPQLLENLRGMGFFSAYMDKPHSNVEIFTAQGSKKNVKMILKQIKEYLSKAGGGVGGSIKEEIILSWWLSDSQIAVPPIASIGSSISA
jgi:hypothetical protein